MINKEKDVKNLLLKVNILQLDYITDAAYVEDLMVTTEISVFAEFV